MAFFLIERLLAICFGPKNEDDGMDSRSNLVPVKVPDIVISNSTFDMFRTPSVSYCNSVMSRKLSISSSYLHPRTGSTVAQLATSGAVNAAELTVSEPDPDSKDKEKNLTLFEKMEPSGRRSSLVHYSKFKKNRENLGDCSRSLLHFSRSFSYFSLSLISFALCRDKFSNLIH